MIEEDRSCVDLVHQIAAVQAALGKVGKLVVASHVESCMPDATQSRDESECKRKLEEFMIVFSRYGQLREW
jgi:DNA-binding FrmR family transcriptional regulator